MIFGQIQYYIIILVLNKINVILLKQQRYNQNEEKKFLNNSKEMNVKGLKLSKTD